jgi:hypothetical protein
MCAEIERIIMLIYIIGKITGNPDYREQFARAEEALRKKYACDIINPAVRGDMAQSDYARLSYNAVTKADAIAVLWTAPESFGATMERLIAFDAGKRMMSITPEYEIKEVEA